MNDQPTCYACGTPDTGETRKRGDARSTELRPYGPGGAWVCYDCAFSSPEREAQTKAAFGALLDGNAAISPSGAVVIGESEGPRPFDVGELS